MPHLIGGGNNLPMTVSQGFSNLHRGNVSSRIAGRSFYVSRDVQKAFHWTSAWDTTIGSVFFSIQNLSKTLNLYIEDVHLSSLTNTSWDFYFTQPNDVPAGTTLSSINLNRFGPDSSDVAIFGNAAVTGITNTTTSRFLRLQTGDHRQAESDFEGGLILGLNDALNIQITGATIGGAGDHFMTMRGYFE